ncbi:hypothetical protein WOLCODRAFT_154851 [Wolfiporia cocos MD-104 SS10]|uniref:Uncharacterized protein n=1 Tax=Wolfiporia cocos (strain MD-104) TaxID=742152 RepID=A0A2H3JSA0_WOLCO|nr:hypothetical protein WOLCODRAFT_154851 [Wolfiporia cocos MD-104 SS10]
MRRTDPDKGGPTPHPTVERHRDTNKCNAPTLPHGARTRRHLRGPLVAIPDLRLMKAKTPGPDDDSQRPPPPLPRAWALGHRDPPAFHHRHPSPPLRYTAKADGTDDAAWLVPRAPPLPR